jgi:hypothetical protein
MTATETRPLATLVLDETLYPRHALSAVNVSAITEALRAGEVMPPVLIDAKTTKVVDGWHRITAYEKLYGAEYAVPVIAKIYRNKAAMLSDAIAANVARGADLTRWDLTRCLVLADEVGLSIDTLAGLVKWRPERLVTYRESRMAKTPDNKRMEIKRSIRHKWGQKLTAAQVEANEHLSGMSPLFHVNQLVMLLESGLMPEDTNARDRLAHLSNLIGGWLDSQQEETNAGS